MEGEVLEKLIAKNQRVRFEKYVELQNELLATGKSLVVADSYEAAYQRFKRIVAHAEDLWEDEELAALAGRDFLIPCAELSCRAEETVIITGPLLLSEAREVHLGHWSP